jgi:hypothetical protein
MNSYFQHKRYVEAQREYKKAQELDANNNHIQKQLDILSRLVTPTMLKSYERERQQSSMTTTPSNSIRTGQSTSAIRVGSTASKTKYALNSSITMISQVSLNYANEVIK